MAEGCRRANEQIGFAVGLVNARLAARHCVMNLSSPFARIAQVYRNEQAQRKECYSRGRIVILSERRLPLL